MSSVTPYTSLMQSFTRTVLRLELYGGKLNTVLRLPIQLEDRRVQTKRCVVRVTGRTWFLILDAKRSSPLSGSPCPSRDVFNSLPLSADIACGHWGQVMNRRTRYAFLSHCALHCPSMGFFRRACILAGILRFPGRSVDWVLFTSHKCIG